MEKEGIKYISERYTKDDYNILNLSTNSPEEDWKKAIDIFHERIYGRFVEPADELNKNVEKNGFAIMALVSLLIETMAQFIEGKENSVGISESIYVSFLRKEFPKDFTANKARSFYEGIRCGILHSAQTQKNTVLTIEGDLIKNDINGDIIINVKKMLLKMSQYIKRYEKKLIDVNNLGLREKFIFKMNCICKK